jgi:hypothetical protein
LLLDSQNAHITHEVPLHPVKVGVWCAVSARGIVVPVFLMKQLIAKDIYVQKDSIFNTSCDL